MKCVNESLVHDGKCGAPHLDRDHGKAPRIRKRRVVLVGLWVRRPCPQRRRVRSDSYIRRAWLIPGDQPALILYHLHKCEDEV